MKLPKLLKKTAKTFTQTTGNNMNKILDTNIIIEYFKGNEIVAKNILNSSYNHIPATVVGELYFGAYRSANAPKHIEQIRGFFRMFGVYDTNEDTAKCYGIIKNQLLAKGKPIPENDIWIAALAMQYEIPLYTNDNHFKEIDGISLYVPE